MSFREDFFACVVTILICIISMSQLGTLCYFGERITNASGLIVQASFESNWIEQPPWFKSALIILQTVAQRELNIKAGGIVLSRKNFFKVIH